MQTYPSGRVALALDNVSSLQALSKLVLATAPWIAVYKIGLEQFTRFGPTVLGIIRGKKRKIFLDLKFHDIPNTVGKAVESACALDIDYLTIHTLGGIPMMRAAKAAATASRRKKAGKQVKIIGVTLLTSIDKDCLQKELAVTVNMSDYICHLALLAVKAGLDGIVCSAADLPVVKPLLPPDFEIITPGIRSVGMAANDQKRIATPKAAVINGATLLVLGRAVTGAENPAKAAEAIVKEISDI
jgi:orotidine-5'-phosphate decarboxylase